MSSSTRSTGGSIPREYIPAVDQGIQEAMDNGILAGYPLVDVRATLIDGSFHEVDSSEMAFKIAGSMALKEAARKADPVLLEPVMEFEVTTPEEFLGDVMGDVTARRGRIENIDERSGQKIVRVLVPLAELFGYATDLRSQDPGSGGAQPDAAARLQRGAGADRARRSIARVTRRVARERDREERTDGQAEVRAHQAPRQHRHDRPHRPRQDHPDRGHHQGARPTRAWPTSPRSTRSTRPRKRASAASPSPSPTWSTRPTTATTPTWTARATPTTSRT